MGWENMIKVDYSNKINASETIKNWFQNVNKNNHIIIQMSGVKYKEIEGQRPLRITDEALKENISVVYAYLRLRYEPIEIVIKNSNLLIIPFDVLLELKDEIFKLNIENYKYKKILLIHIPHRSCLEVISTAKSYGWFIVYDCMDLYKDFMALGQAYWYSEIVEANISKQSDLVTVTNDLLGKNLMRFGVKKYLLVPNGVNPSKLNRDLKPFDLPRSKEITIGFFGYITNAWFDWDVLLELARKHKEWIFHIIWWGEDWPKGIPNNIISLGPIPHEDLPHYSANWDIGLLNFKNTYLVKCSCPIKVYEYLWLGLPVVSIDIPYLRNYPYVYTCNNINDFEKNIVLAKRQKFNRHLVDNFLQNYTWNHHFHTILSNIEQGDAIE
jgi:glycosyltransferase involved in cell wall biosynthesis